jgi:hypothetical protein
MSSEDDSYRAKRELKAVTSRGSRHRSTISGIGIFPEPLDLPVRERRRRKKVEEKRMFKQLENAAISIDLDVEDIDVDETFLERLTERLGIDNVEKDFEVLQTASKVLRALAKAKIRNVMYLKLDGETIYENPDDYYDVDEALDAIMNEIKVQESSGDRITIDLLSADFEDLWVEVKVNRVHLPWRHDVLIKFHGEMNGEYFLRVINYLEEHLKIEDIEKEWRKA